MKEEGVGFRGFVDYCGNGSKCRDPSSLSTTRHRTQVLAAAKASMSFNVHSPARNVHSAQYTVSNAHRCNKRAHITHSMYMCTCARVHVYLYMYTTHTVHMCTFFEVAQVRTDLMLGRGSKVGRLGAGGLRGITPTNHLRMHTREKSNKCKQCDSRYLFSGILGHI